MTALLAVVTFGFSMTGILLVAIHQRLVEIRRKLR